MLKEILATAKEELGLPSGARLTAGLHSFLIYEPNQFSLAHQDSEKDDSMVGTLVVTLPSSYTGAAGGNVRSTTPYDIFRQRILAAGHRPARPGGGGMDRPEWRS